jgi:ankyrin repeat protein
LASHGGDLWIRNIRGDLPLHEAVQSGRRDLVLWLLNQRPEAVNAANNDGRCPLHIAALNDNIEMCKVRQTSITVLLF